MEPKHPTRGGTLTPLERFLWRFRMAAHEAQVMWRGFNAYPDAATAINEDLLFGLTNQALIIVSKFLEIWNEFGKLAKEESRVVPARRAIQPIVDRIYLWKGLDKYRNTTLAHPYTTKSGDLLPPWELLRTGQAPSFHAEIMLLLQLVVFAVASILAVFEAEYRLLDPLTGPSGSPAGPGDGIAKGTEIAGVLGPLLTRVDEQLQKECGVVLKGDLLRMFRAAIRP
jgi:hypothetical protein